MATNSRSDRSANLKNRSAAIQWTAIGIVAALAMIAAFVFFGSDDGTTGQSGLGVEVGALATINP